MMILAMAQITKTTPAPCETSTIIEANFPDVVLITGANSQLAQALLRVAAEVGYLFSNTGIPFKLCALNRSQLDITNAANIAAVFSQYRPNWVINCAAYNAVDAAENDIVKAHRVNALGPELLAQQCLQSGARLLHVSSDYVFGGNAAHDIDHNAENVSEGVIDPAAKPHYLASPCVELDHPKPLSEYAKSKLLGEQKVFAVLGDRATVVRTSWLYGQDGHNFVKTMLKLMQTQPSLQVIDDQIGCPTWSDALARVMWQLVAAQCSGLFHYSAKGQCSWHEFAVEIQQQALVLNLLNQPVVILPISSTAYAKQALTRGVNVAKRPSYSVLNSDKLQFTLATHARHSMFDNIEWQDWRQQLNQMLRQLS
ncbi:dTDP-4-dehydrorhamnose reductase [Shewanella morhuae]|uniref:dTDP-4-dehydrorhamnose reductase n=1 Tax=Shewanella morhuae TaxID=365591 RepID=UPI000970E8A7|nr:dTDP-4-dehydrorhamnose reductase [Shewanella morhuae]